MCPRYRDMANLLYITQLCKLVMELFPPFLFQESCCPREIKKKFNGDHTAHTIEQRGSES